MDKKTIFVDANYWFALTNTADSLHEKSTAVSKIIESQDYKAYTSNYVLLECYAVISQKINKGASIKFKNLIEKDGSLKIIWLDEILDKKIWKIFKQAGSKDLSYVDASNIAIIQFYGIDYFLTFDKNLQKLSSKFNFKNLIS